MRDREELAEPSGNEGQRGISSRIWSTRTMALLIPLCPSFPSLSLISPSLISPFSVPHFPFALVSTGCLQKTECRRRNRLFVKKSDGMQRNRPRKNQCLWRVLRWHPACNLRSISEGAQQRPILINTWLRLSRFGRFHDWSFTRRKLRWRMVMGPDASL